MIAAVIALAALAAALTGAVIACGAWLRSEVQEGKHLRDRLDDSERTSREHQSARDVTDAALEATQRKLEEAERLRAIAEAQRNEAQRRVTELMTQHMKEASPDEIQATVTEVFRTPLSLAPGTALIDPFK